MSDINIEQTPLNITISPNTTQLTVFAGGYAQAQGNTTEVQYNNGGVLAGANGLTYNSGTQTTTAGNLTVTNNTDLGNIGNITISGGNSGEVLTTDGSGGLSFTEIANANFASFAGNVIEAAQPNITSVGNLSNLTVTGNVSANYFLGNGSQLTGLAEGDEISNGTSNVRVVSANGNVAISVNGNANVLVANSTGITVTRANLGNIANLTIIGGNNGMVLQTDGTGNLTWTTMTGNAGNGVVGGSNTQIQYNDGGAFGGSANLTFNKASNVLTCPGNITTTGNISANYYIGNGSLLSGLQFSTFSNGNSNIAIVVANGNINHTVSGNANILVVTGTGINVAGTLNSTGNANIGNIGTAQILATANITAPQLISNVTTGTPPFVVTSTTTVANLSVGTAGTVTTAAQPNITSLGTLTSLSISGNASFSGITTLNSSLENVSLITNQSNTYNFDLIGPAIKYTTANANANVTLNFRGNSSVTGNSLIGNGQSITATYVLKNGSTGYTISGIQIDSASQTIKWLNGVTPPIEINSTLAYTFTIVKTATTPTYEILGTQSLYA